MKNKRLIAVSLLSSASLSAAPPSAARSAAGACIDTDRIATRVPAGAQALSVTLVGGRRVTIAMEEACAHLDEVGSRYLLEFDHRQRRRLCVGDRLRPVDPLLSDGAGASGTPFCRVATITPAA